MSGVQSRDSCPVRFHPPPPPSYFRNPDLHDWKLDTDLFFFVCFFFDVSKEVRHFCAFRSVRLEPERSNDAPVHESADVSVTPPNASFFLAGGFLLLTRRRAAAAPARPPVRAAAANTQSQRLILSRARRSSRRHPHKCHHRRLWPRSPPRAGWHAGARAEDLTRTRVCARARPRRSTRRVCVHQG